MNIQIIIDGFAQAQRAPQGVIVPPLPPAIRRHHTVRMYSPAEVRKWQAEARFLASKAMEDKNPLKGQLIVDIAVYLAPPMSMSKKKLDLALAGRIRPITRPDCDNYAKSTLDALNQIVWLDDSQIVTLTVSKWYAEKPRVVVHVNEIPWPPTSLEGLKALTAQSGLFK
jgi:Holliday junction resolvase RusA-like endonuclease